VIGGGGRFCSLWIGRRIRFLGFGGFGFGMGVGELIFRFQVLLGGLGVLGRRIWAGFFGVFFLGKALSRELAL
jgi:hypothetical protein